MRLLHTSDWHLGRYLQTVPLVEHQRDFLTWLGQLARERQVDAILISGDVYDRAIPSIDAVRLFQEGLVGLVEICPVVLISGNHDSPTRLGFGGPLLEAARVHLRSSVDDIDRPVELTNADRTVLVYGLPYLEPEVVRTALAAEKSHEAVLTAAMDRVRADLAARREAAGNEGLPAPHAVVMAHAFITGGTASDSERDVSVGGIADAPASVFNGVDYVALGHLHGPQQVGNAAGPLTRYSGSPLAYSFSEESHEKSVTLVEIDAHGGVSTEIVRTPVPRSLRTITGDLADLLTDVALTEAEDSWVRAVVTDPRRPENPMESLRARFPHAIELTWYPHVDGEPLPDVAARVDPASADPVEIVTSFIEHVTGQPPDGVEQALIRASVERVRIAEAAQ